MKYREVKRQAKVGEKIKIVSAFSTGGNYKNTDVLTVSPCSTLCHGAVHVKEFEQPYIYAGEYVVLEEIAEFELSDFKPCFVVVRRDKSVCAVFESKNGIIFQSTDGRVCSQISRYKADLKSMNGSEFDIMQVYGFSDGSFEISIKNRPLLFERIEKSPVQIKLEELESKRKEIEAEMKKLMEGAE